MTPVSASLRRARPLLGTFVEIALTDPSRADAHAAIDAAFAAVSLVHRLMSAHEPESDVSRLNRDAAAAPIRIHPWTYEVLAAAGDLYRQSGGAFDVAVAPFLEALGVLPASAVSPRAARRGFDAVELLPDGRVRLAADVRIDLGGIAKGFAVDRAIAVLRRRGVAGALVNAGGDLAAFGPPQRIHLRDPRCPSRLLCRVDIADEALASSAASAANAGPVAAPSAIVDPATGMRARGVAGATVRAKTCMLADALTKLVMLHGVSAAPLLSRHGASALVVASTGGICITADWAERVEHAA